MKQAFTHIVVKILFDYSTGFGEMRWPLMSGKQTLYMTWIKIS